MQKPRAKQCKLTFINEMKMHLQLHCFFFCEAKCKGSVTAAGWAKPTRIPPRCTSSVYAHAGVSGDLLLHGVLPSQFLHSYLCEVSAKKLGMSHLSDSSLRGVRRSSFTESAPFPHGFLTFVGKCVFPARQRVNAPAADYHSGVAWGTKFH